MQSIIKTRHSTGQALIFLLFAGFLLYACNNPEKTANRTQEQSQYAPAPAATTEEADSREPTTPAIPKSSDIEALAAAPSYLILRGNEPVDMAVPVQEITAKLSNDSLMYKATPMSDCSGIFHRVLQGMQQRFPAYHYPSPDTFRSTRGLARWYHDQGDFILISDALAMSDLIKPGAVMFFGRQDSLYQNFTAENLFEPTGIEHMGVVVSVERDADGQVSSYKLFHGRSTGKYASVTNHHKRKPSRPNLPPLGNWNQQWVAFARLVNPVQ